MAGKSKEIRALITLAGKLDPTLQSAMMKATAESAKASGKIGKHWGALGQTVKSGAIGLMKGLGTTLLAGAVTASVAFGAMGVAGLKYASDLGEVQNVVDVTFGQSAAVIDAFAAKSLEVYGLSALEAKRYSSTLGAMLKSMGLSSDQTLVMSQNMTALAGDIASFYNLTGDEAFEKIRAGISGETEPLKQLGIVMSVANLEAYALREGITTAYSAMGQADQSVLRYNYLLSAAADAQGDFGNTIDSFSNQQKLMKANLQQTSGEIMSHMMPALAGAMQEANGFIQSLNTEAIGGFAGELASMAVGFMPLIMDLMPAFGSLLGMLMPPLMEIGQLLIPIVVDVVRTLMVAVAPLIPLFMNLVQLILPPLAALIKAIAPLISMFASVFTAALVPALSIVSSLLTPLCEMFAKFAAPIAAWVGKIAGGVSGDVVKSTAANLEAGRQMLGVSGADLPKYANGGFSSRPAIFGEAGPEAAIPIKRGSPRSLDLLQRTAQLLGVNNRFDGDDRSKIQLTYAPVFQMDGDPGERISAALRQGYVEMRRMVEDFFADRGRLAWD